VSFFVGMYFWDFRFK